LYSNESESLKSRKCSCAKPTYSIKI